MTIIRSPRADDDAWSAWSYIAAHDLAAADRWLDLIDRRLCLLERDPHIGRAREELGVELRSFTAGSYLLFYRPLDDGVELVRVLHGARDLTQDLFD